VIHRLGRLQVDQQHRGAGPLGDRRDHGCGHIRGEEADDQVAAGPPQEFGRLRALVGVGDEPGIDDIAVQSGQPLRDPARRLLQLRQQSGELGPVRAQTARDEADTGTPGGNPR
jgi:hypothetical protein